MTPDGNVATQAEELHLWATKLEVLLGRFSRVRVTVCLGSLVGWRRKRRDLGRELSACAYQRHATLPNQRPASTVAHLGGGHNSTLVPGFVPVSIGGMVALGRPFGPLHQCGFSMATSYRPQI
jgi:hypothetical protein